jgi:polysaccharide pyruvyl transferase WcaK-like protein
MGNPMDFWTKGEYFQISQINMSIFLNFDFYGSHNVGDDLMVAGFLEVFPHSLAPLECQTKQHIASQRIRFPQIQWEPVSTKDIQPQCLLGIGDTPFQLTSGVWFLEKLLRDAKIAKDKNIPMYMIGVGAEKEVKNDTKYIHKILESISHIWTRDEFSKQILVDNFKFPDEKVTASSDLANIYLDKWSQSIDFNRERPVDLAVCFFAEEKLLQPTDIPALKKFFRKNATQLQMVFNANETRKREPFEWYIYHQLMFNWFDRTFRPLPNLTYYSPEYATGSMNDLIDSYKDYKTVLTSRYHGLMTAAWAGCKVAVLERSSKVSALAQELGIPIIQKPFTVEKIEEGYANAKVVDRNLLASLSKNAKQSVEELAGVIGKLYK